jgi:2,3-bisphosphoglycerate-independent phosphoglycerate mutase
VPTLIASRWARPSAERFGETACRAGDLGVLPATDLMALALAHAGRLDKYGA